ncbi:hypothetical protein LGG40_001059 [Salmonella enterica]|nr:hypothetical protein [Salmonella enterica]EBH6191567.1 hypothetical protein [Salmonella enterica]EHQ1740963.1 hypothetical protein [Salmonella enterica subsp. enterica serovar Oranienburg]EIH0773580.1 hypothetical protein [Salmonella enterica]EKZ3117953.1 hypothetical protein [Salmonella enterica]
MYEVKKNKACGVKTAGFFVKRHKKRGHFVAKTVKNPLKSSNYTKKKGRNAAFLVIRVIFQANRYAVIPLIYFRDGSVSAAIHPDGCYAWI